MKNININELRKIQLEILTYVHKFCVENKINYTIAYGTLLGAVRHKGYIPWDDDIDIAMPRKDYEKFVQSFNNSSHFYKLYDARYNDNFNYNFAKVADTRTIIEEAINSVNIGINIDVFPIDYLTDNYNTSLKACKKLNILNFLYLVKIRYLSYIKKWWKKPIVAICKLFLFNYSAHQITLSIIKKVSEISSEKAKYIAYIGEYPQKEIMKSSIYDKYELISFEGSPFYTVSEYDEYLKVIYGNYLELPPLDKQKPKHDYIRVYWK